MAFPFLDRRADSTTATTLESGEPMMNVTRHLSAGAYLDPGFCLAALREVYYRPDRIPVPAYGFDQIMVLRHCLRARRGMVIRDVTLVSTFLAACATSPGALLLLLGSLMAIHVLETASDLAAEQFRLLRTRLPEDKPLDAGAAPDYEPEQRGPSQPAADAGPMAALWSGHLTGRFLSRLASLAANYTGLLLIGVPLASAVRVYGFSRTHGVGPMLLVSTALLTLALASPSLWGSWNRLQLRRLRQPGAVPARPPAPMSRLADIRRESGGNTVVYGGYEPFVGSGVSIRHWDFALRLVRPAPLPFSDRDLEIAPGLAEEDQTRSEADREFAVPPFTAAEVSRFVRDHLASLIPTTDPDPPESYLTGLTVQDRVFVAGVHADEAGATISAPEVEWIIRNPTSPQRHFLVCQIVSWRGELVTTVYVHFAVQGKVLYVELHVRGLLPCLERFRVVDTMVGTGPRMVLGDAARGMAAAPAIFARAPASLTRALIDALRLPGRRHAAPRLRRVYDCGATWGLRDMASSWGVEDHMQTQDIVKYGRIIERRVIGAIMDFLDRRDVDVGEFRQRSMTILNAGAVAIGNGTVTVNGDVNATQNINSEGSPR
jgi:hypothetical protein